MHYNVAGIFLAISKLITRRLFIDSVSQIPLKKKEMSIIGHYMIFSMSDIMPCVINWYVIR